MYKKIRNINLHNDIKKSKLIEVLDFEDMSLEIYARYTKDDYSEDSIFCSYFKYDNQPELCKEPMKEFINILKNYKYHLDPECKDGLGLDITKNVEIIIELVCEYEGSQGTFILII